MVKNTKIIRGQYMKNLSELYKTDYKNTMKWNDFLKNIAKGKVKKLNNYVEEIKKIPYNEYDNQRNTFIKNVMKDYANLGTYCTIPMRYKKNENKNRKRIIKKDYYTIPYTWLVGTNGVMSYNNIKKKLEKFEKSPENFKQSLRISESNRELNEINQQLLLNFVLGSDEFYGGIPDYAGATFSSGVVNGDIMVDCSTKILFQQNEEYIKDCCFYNSMKHYKIEKEEYKKINKFDDIKNILMNLNINYVIFNDYFSFTKSNVMNNQGEKITYKDNIYIQINIKPKVINKNIIDKTKQVFYFAMNIGVNKNHIFVPYESINNFFINSTYSKVFIHKYDKLIQYNKIKNIDVNGYRYIYYDLETIQDFNIDGFFREISISISYFDIENTMTTYDEDYIKNQLINNCKFDLKDDLNIFEIIKKCMDKNRHNKIISFNGSRFDNIFLLKSMKENKYEPCIMVNNGMVELNNNKLSSLLFSTHDICRFITGKLSEISENFIKNEELRKVKRLDLFVTMQELYEDNKKLYTDLKFAEELKKYNDLDIISLGLIHYNFYKELKYILKEVYNEEEIINCVSISQYVFKIFTSSIKDNQIKPKKFTEKIKNNETKKVVNNSNILKIYDAMHVKKTGGRCQAGNKYIINYNEEEINNEECILNNIKNIIKDFDLKSMDVASLYPFVMCMYKLGFFMAGELIFTQKYIKNKTGVYFIDITQNLKENEQIFYCEKNEEGNNWNVDGKKIENIIMTSVEYEEILKNKPHWEIKIKYGFYTNKSVKGCDLFKVLLPFLREKTRQDFYKQTKDIKFNPALRETCKQICNSLSGKFLQQFKKIEYQIENFEIISVDLENENRNDYLKNQMRRDKMLHVGLFIYSLSKVYMYKYMYGCIDKKDFTYTDTDSYKFILKESFNKWMDIYGNIKMKDLIFKEIYNDNELGFNENTTLYFNGDGVKKIGQFEDEYNKKGYDKGIYMDKKEYMVYNSEKILKNENIKDGDYKIMFKGVSKEFLILNDEIENINVNFRKKKTNEILNINSYNDLNDEDKEKYVPELNISDLVYSSYKINKEIGEKFKSLDKIKMIKNFEKLFLNKLKGKKTPILMQFFSKNILSKSIRKEYIIKLI